MPANSSTRVYASDAAVRAPKWRRRQQWVGSALAGWLILIGGAARAGVLERLQFTKVQPLPSGLHSVAFGAGQYVAVGGSTVLATSSDGTHWTNPTVPRKNDMAWVTYGGGQFVTVGPGGTLFTSSTGVSWSNQVSGTIRNLRSVTFGNGLYVAVGDAGTILTSINGRDWVGQTAGTTHGLISVAFGDSRFVAAGSTNILESTDGVSWSQPAVSNSSIITRVVFGLGRFMTDTGLVSTSKGTWVQAQQGLPPSSGLSFTENEFMAFYQGSLQITIDGLVWTTVGDLPNGAQLAQAAFGNGLYVGVGPSGELISTDGIQWSTVSFPSSLNLVGAGFAQGRFYTVGSEPSQVWSSPDGATWTGALITSREGVFFSSASGMVYGNGRYLLPAGSMLVTSTNAQDWEVLQLNVGVHEIAFGDGLFAGAGDQGTVITSTDGVSWRLANSGTSNRLNSVSFGGHRFVAAGNNGTILTSTNGQEWLLAQAPTNGILLSVAYSDGVFVCVGTGGTILNSSDGLKWNLARSPTTVTLQRIAAGNEIFAAVGPGVILTSTNGVSWTRINPGATGLPIGIAYGAGRFLAVFSNTILQADLVPGILDPPGITPEGVALPINGLIGKSYQIEATTSLALPDWAPIGSVTNTQLTTVFTDMTAAGAPHRFYRTRLEQ
jgi:hypothetical protein